MSYNDKYRLSVHAIILNNKQEVLMLKATYNENNWVLPGGAIDPGETIYEALTRECQEELGKKIKVKNLSGMYYHKKHNSYTIIIRCDLSSCVNIRLSSEHSDYRFINPTELKPSQTQRILDCINYYGEVKSFSFN